MGYTKLHFELHFRSLSGGKGYGCYIVTLCYYYIETIKMIKNKIKKVLYIGTDQSVTVENRNLCN